MKERTFIAIKPDGVKRGLMGEVIRRFELKGLKITGMKMLNVTDEQAKKHYGEHEGKPFYPGLISYIQSGPIVALVVEGENAIATCRQLMGKTNPNDADVGTIRADLSLIMSNNTVHGSDGPESAEREISIYFDESEICSNYKNMTELIAEGLA